MTCIYCCRDVDRGEFTREHVIPVAFGTFRPNPTLTDGVCGECNQFFGDTIDFATARGSPEAIHRLNLGVQPPRKAEFIRRDRVRLAWDREDEWGGLVLRLVADRKGLAVEPVPQVGFRRKSGNGFVYVPEEELRDPSRALPTKADSNDRPFLISNSNETKERLTKLLARRGIGFRESSRVSMPTKDGEMLPVEIRARIDALVLRCISKIAFNYLAYTQSPDFVRRDDFSTIRELIRYGKPAPYPVVTLDSLPLLRDDGRRHRQTNGHLVTVNWAADGVSIVGQVSLFNHARYCVSLARNFRGVLRDIRSGHHFDVESGEVEALFVTSLIVPR